MIHAVQSRERKLDQFFARAKKNNKDEEIVADLARLGAVLVCGYVERCVEVIILERLQARAHPRVINFLKTHFKRGTNYNCEAICQLLERFDGDWAKGFRAKVEGDDQLSSSLISLYTLRNSIAHGGDQNLGLIGVEALYNTCKSLVQILIDSTKA